MKEIPIRPGQEDMLLGDYKELMEVTKNPHLCRIFDTFTKNNILYTATDFFDGNIYIIYI